MNDVIPRPIERTVPGGAPRPVGLSHWRGHVDGLRRSTARGAVMIVASLAASCASALALLLL